MGDRQAYLGRQVRTDLRMSSYNWEECPSETGGGDMGGGGKVENSCGTCGEYVVGLALQMVRMRC